MDIFDLREGLINDFSSYVESFIKIADDRIRDKVERYFKTGKLWPEPRIQLNPSFERGTPIPDLIAEGLLHPECEQIFRHGKKDVETDGMYSPGETIVGWILSRVFELIYTSWDRESFARDLGYDGPPFPWDPERRFQLRCELDAAFFHLYGISAEDADYTLPAPSPSGTFPIVRRRDETKYGHYRTKEIVLNLYDD